MTYPSRFAVRYSYTGLGYTQTITDAGSGPGLLGRQRARRRASSDPGTAGNGVVTVRGFDATTRRLKSGRSNGSARREGEHARDIRYPDYDFQEVYPTNDYSAQRGLEQTLHDTFKPPLDQIRPISPQNPNAGQYMDAAKRYLDNQ